MIFPTLPRGNFFRNSADLLVSPNLKSLETVSVALGKVVRRWRGGEEVRRRSSFALEAGVKGLGSK